MSGPVVIFLGAAAWETRWAAIATALSAASLGDPVHVALFADALRAFVSEDFDAGAPPRAAEIGEPLSTSLRDARALGVRVVACETAVRLAGLDAAQVVPPLDGLVSLPALWRLADGGRLLTF